MSEEMKDVELGTGGEIFPPKNDTIALIDADTIAFAASSACEYFEEILNKELYLEDEWTAIITDPNYDEANGLLYGINMDEAVQHCLDKIDLIMNRTGCKDFQLHFTVGRESFRYTKVDKEYKANRLIDSQGEKTRAPTSLYAIKQELVRKFKLKAMMWYECEADDAVWWLGDKYPEKYIVVAVDKDVLGATKSEAFNYYQRAAYIHPKSGNAIKEIQMKFQTAEMPEEFWYHQCITGDKGDGIIGLHGVGPAGAKKCLRGCKTDLQRWNNIVALYEKRGRTMLDALFNMRMVRLDQFNPETNVLTLFDPRNLEGVENE